MATLNLESLFKAISLLDSLYFQYWDKNDATILNGNTIPYINKIQFYVKFH